MSENKHTPEPWKVVNRGDEYADDIDAFKGEGWNADVTLAMNIGKANARRIVACVNALSGCNTEFLESMPIGFFNSTYGNPHYLEKLEKQRDDLLAVVQKLAKWNKDYPSSRVYGYGEIKRIASEMDAINAEALAAIASMKGIHSGDITKMVGGEGINSVVKESLTTETAVPAIVFYPAGSLGEEIEEEGRPA